MYASSIIFDILYIQQKSPGLTPGLCHSHLNSFLLSCNKVNPCVTAPRLLTVLVTLRYSLKKRENNPFLLSALACSRILNKIILS
jgi:hypothetical protein